MKCMRNKNKLDFEEKFRFASGCGGQLTVHNLYDGMVILFQPMHLSTFSVGVARKTPDCLE
jgi:hypothetical protein